MSAHCEDCAPEYTSCWNDGDKCTKRPRSFAAPSCCAAPCVTRIGDSNGKAFVVYLRDGTKITVGRDKTTKGPAWLEVSRQLEIKAQHNSDYATSRVSKS